MSWRYVLEAYKKGTGYPPLYLMKREKALRHLKGIRREIYFRQYMNMRDPALHDAAWVQDYKDRTRMQIVQIQMTLRDLRLSYYKGRP